MSPEVKWEQFTDAPEQAVQCHLKTFTEKQWVSEPCGNTESVEMKPFGERMEGGQTAVAEELAWKYSES